MTLAPAAAAAAAPAASPSPSPSPRVWDSPACPWSDTPEIPDTPKEFESVVMEYGFAPEEGDAEQLACEKGDVLYLLATCGDGWSQVKQKSSGAVGIVPSDYYAKLS